MAFKVMVAVKVMLMGEHGGKSCDGASGLGWEETVGGRERDVGSDGRWEQAGRCRC